MVQCFEIFGDKTSLDFLRFLRNEKLILAREWMEQQRMIVMWQKGPMKADFRQVRIQKMKFVSLNAFLSSMLRHSFHLSRAHLKILKNICYLSKNIVFHECSLLEEAHQCDVQIDRIFLERVRG
jgi:hypothetical protein